MRFFEAVLIVINLIAFSLFPFTLPDQTRNFLINSLSGIALLVMLVHLWFEGYRWQMLPIYGVSLILGLLMSARLFQIQNSEFGSIVVLGSVITFWTAILGIILVLMGGILALVLPVPKIPYLVGDYAIGTVTYHWVDASRNEIYSTDPTEARELMVQVWYPAEPNPKGQPLAWIPEINEVGPAIAQRFKVPFFLLNHLRLVKSDVYEAAPLAQSQANYPVIIYSHGWGSFRKINLDQIETLASHGYIVITVDHTYASLATVFPDGRTIPLNPATLPADAPDEIYWPAAKTLVDIYAADVTFVLDQLTPLNSGEVESMFTHRLNLEQIGLFGHSTGGGAIVEVCSLDSRCKAGLGQDAWVRPVTDDIIEQGLSQPFLFMRSEPWLSGENEERLMRLYTTLPTAGYLLGILGAKHRDYTLLALMSPLASTLGIKGPINGYRMVHIVDSYVLAFFDKHLKVKESPLLNGPSPEYPEVLFEKR